jgi:hypothetical protein
LSCATVSISNNKTHSCEATNSRHSTADTTASGHGGAVESTTTLVGDVELDTNELI